MDIYIAARIDGSVTLDEADWVDVTERDGVVIVVQSARLNINAADGTVKVFSGVGYARKKDGTIGNRKRQVWGYFTLPQHVLDAVHARLREEIDRVAALEVP